MAKRRPPESRSRREDDDDDDLRRGSAKSGPDGRRRPPGSSQPGLLGFLLKWLLVLGIWAAVAVAVVLAWFAYDLPDVSGISNFSRRPSITFVSADGQPIATYGDSYAGPVALDQMSPWLPKAVLDTEDRRFYSHIGIDVIGLARATVANLRAGHIVQGGSTITQQLAKNVFLSPERSYRRKIQEVLLALWLEHKFTKTQILTIYLNRVYLGAGTYGVEAAAQRYFGKSSRNLSPHEAAVIAGLLKAPSRYSPLADPDRARARAHDVLLNLVEAGDMTPPQAAAAERQPLGVAQSMPGRGTRYFTDWLADSVPGFAGFVDRDLTVVTTLDSRLQKVAEEDVARTLEKDGPRQHASQAAMLVMSPDGAVRAMVGGRDYASGQFNHVTEAHRQPGSSFKAFVYLAAMEYGIRPDDRFSDGPITIGTWSPRNFEKEQNGMITVRDAFAHSVNTTAVRIAQKIGIDRVIAVADRLGIGSPLRRDLATSLGASEVTLYELTSAFAPFANGGNGVLPYAITEIRDAGGNVIYRRQGSGPGPVIQHEPLVEMTDLMQAVVQTGTGRAAMLDRPTAGKTGTSEDFRDAWFLGFTADYVAGVWVGNDNDDPMLRVTGGSLPAHIWHDVMAEAERGRPVKPLPGASGFLDTLTSFLSHGTSPPPPPSPATAVYKPSLGLDPYNRPGATPPP